MKIRIEPAQLNEFSPGQKEALRKWWKPAEFNVVFADPDIVFVTDGTYRGNILEIAITQQLDGELDGGQASFKKSECLPILSIGQMIEMLENEAKARGWDYWEIEKRDNGKWLPKANFLPWIEKEELCDALFMAVKAIL